MNTIFRNKFLSFDILSNLSLTAMLRHLSQPHATTYISSHTEVFYKKVFLKILQKLQENICVVVSYSYNFNKKEALARGVL